MFRYLFYLSLSITMLVLNSYISTPSTLALQVTPTSSPTLTATRQVLKVATFAPGELSIGVNGEIIINTPTPNWKPTPMPRAVLVLTNTAPITTDHLWFGRAFSDRGAWGSFSYPYGTNSRGNYLWHRGIDIAASFGNIIHSIGNGVVVHAGIDDAARQLGPFPEFYGQAVVIQHSETWNGQPVYTLFGHVSATLVQVGQTVKLGDPIAKVGSGGVATGAHLHVEVRVGGNTYNHTRNPDLWLKPDRGFGVIAGRVMDAQGYFVPVQLVKLRHAEDTRRYARDTYSYPNNEVNPDDLYQENFSFADVPIGAYTLEATFDGQTLTQLITVTNQAASFVTLQAPLPLTVTTNITTTTPNP